MSLDLLLAFTIVFAIDSLTPGPSTTMVMVRGASMGTLRVLPIIAGLVIGDLLLFALAVGGLVALAAALGPLFWIVKWGGVAYLLYLAWSLWVADPAPPETADPPAGGRDLVIGILLPLGNPKAVAFYVAILPLVVDATTLGWAEGLIIGAIIATVWFAILTLYAAAGARLARSMRSPCALRALNRTSAGAMVGVAGMAASR